MIEWKDAPKCCSECNTAPSHVAAAVRVAADLVPGVIADSDPEELLAFEVAAATLPPYRDIATQLHLFVRRPI